MTHPSDCKQAAIVLAPSHTSPPGHVWQAVCRLMRSKDSCCWLFAQCILTKHSQAHVQLCSGADHHKRLPWHPTLISCCSLIRVTYLSGYMLSEMSTYLEAQTSTHMAQQQKAHMHRPTCGSTCCRVRQLCQRQGRESQGAGPLPLPGALMTQLSPALLCSECLLQQQLLQPANLMSFSTSSLSPTSLPSMWSASFAICSRASECDSELQPELCSWIVFYFHCAAAAAAAVGFRRHWHRTGWRCNPALRACYLAAWGLHPPLPSLPGMAIIFQLLQRCRSQQPTSCLFAR